MLEDKVQDGSVLLFKLPYARHVMDQRSRDGYFSGRFKIFAFFSGFFPFPDFELLDARIASSLNKIIQKSHCKKKVSLEEQKVQKADRFLRGRQTAYLIYNYFHVSGVNDSLLDYADLFSVVLRNDNIQEFDTTWDEILLSMTRFPPDEILESLYKLRIRESDQHKKCIGIVQSGNSSKESGEQNPDAVPTPRFLRRPSGKNSFNPMEGRSLKNRVVDQQRFQISELHFDKFPAPTTFSCWKMKFKTEVCSCSNCLTEAMLWTKAVEMVDSVDDLKSSCSVQMYTPFPNFELLDARIASALN